MNWETYIYIDFPSVSSRKEGNINYLIYSQKKRNKMYRNPNYLIYKPRCVNPKLKVPFTDLRTKKLLYPMKTVILKEKDKRVFIDKHIITPDKAGIIYRNETYYGFHSGYYDYFKVKPINYSKTSPIYYRDENIIDFSDCFRDNGSFVKPIPKMYLEDNKKGFITIKLDWELGYVIVAYNKNHRHVTLNPNKKYQIGNSHPKYIQVAKDGKYQISF